MQKRSEETRAKIMSVALEMFARQGYDATSVADICREAGVSKGAFYHHFPTKQDIFLALLRGWLSDLDAQLDALLQGADSVPKGLVSVAGATRGVLKAAEGRQLFLMEFWVQASRHPEVWEAAIAPYRHYQQMFANVIQRGIDAGVIQPVDADTAGRTIVALALGLLLQAWFDPEGAAWDKTAVQSMLMLMRGLEKKTL
jgi:AcrR family transcriptional regulator